MTDLRTWEALLRNDFRAFIHKVFETLNPGQTYVPTWHIEAIAYQLERVRRGELRRLIINMPPRSLKSITASVALPAFALGHDPTRRVLCISYSGELASQALLDNNNSFWEWLSPSDWQELLAKSRVPTRRMAYLRR